MADAQGNPGLPDDAGGPLPHPHQASASGYQFSIRGGPPPRPQLATASARRVSTAGPPPRPGLATASAQRAAVASGLPSRPQLPMTVNIPGVPQQLSSVTINGITRGFPPPRPQLASDPNYRVPQISTASTQAPVSGLNSSVDNSSVANSSNALRLIIASFDVRSNIV